MTVSVPADAVGSVMGRRGCNIQKIRRTSGSLLFFDQCGPEGRRGTTPRTLTIVGSPRQISHASRLVIEQISLHYSSPRARGGGGGALTPERALSPEPAAPPSPAPTPGRAASAAPAPALTPKLEAILRGLHSCFLGEAAREQSGGASVHQKLEEAHWCYLDFYQSDHDDLPRVEKLLGFVQLMATVFPALAPHATRQAVQAYANQAASLPRCGAVLLNAAMSKCVLVKSCIGEREVYTFPRGKVEGGETDVACATREIREETGLEIGELLDPSQFIASVNHAKGGRTTKLFMVVGVAESAKLRPACRKEVVEAEWFDLCDLESLAENAHSSFRCIAALMPQLLRWVESRRSPGPFICPARSPPIRPPQPPPLLLPPVRTSLHIPPTNFSVFPADGEWKAQDSGDHPTVRQRPQNRPRGLSALHTIPEGRRFPRSLSTVSEVSVGSVLSVLPLTVKPPSPHSADSEKTLVCTACGETFGDPSDFGYHCALCEGGHSDDEEPMTF